MKHTWGYVLLIAAAMACYGCPYESEVPISEPSVKVDQSLTGTWINTANNGRDIYEISAKDAYSYRVTLKRAAEEKDESYTGYLSDVNGQTFVNVQPESAAAAGKWLLFKFNRISNTQFRLAEVTENIDETFASSRELQKFIAANMKHSFFYGHDELNFVRGPR